MLSHYSRTRKGHQELKTRTHKLTARQRALLLIIENVQWDDTDPVSVQQLSTADNVKRLLELQLIEAVNDSVISPATTERETPAVEAVLHPVQQPAPADLMPGRYKVILAELTPKKPFGTLYDFISLPKPVAAEVAQQASPVNAAADAGLTEEAARKSVFLSYLPYLGGKKKPAQDAAVEPTVAAIGERTDEPVQASAELAETALSPVGVQADAEVMTDQAVIHDSIVATDTPENVALVSTDLDVDELALPEPLTVDAVSVVQASPDAEAELAHAELASTDVVQAVADEQVVVEAPAVDNTVAEDTVQSLTVAAKLQTDSEPLTAVAELEPVVVETVSSAEVVSLVEVDVAQAEVVEAVADIASEVVDTTVVSGQPATDELALVAPEATDAVQAVEAVSSIEAEVADAELADTDADVDVLALQVDASVVEQAEVLASEALHPTVVADDQAVLQQAADEVAPALEVGHAAAAADVLVDDSANIAAQQDVHAEAVEQVARVEAEAQVNPAVTAAEASDTGELTLQPVSVISTLTVNTKQALTTADFSNNSNSSHSLADVQLEVVAEGAHAESMLYIADHNAKWQERHIPLLVWTVTMPGTKKQQKKLELPLKLYNVDEFEQVWDAKPPYGSH